MKGLRWEGTLNARNHETGLDVPPGRVLAVVGPNGAGKSTLLDLLCGLLKPDHGRLDIDGQVLVDSRRFVPAHRRGLLGQQPLLFPHLDVLGNVAYGPRAQRLRRDEARALALEMLERLDAADLASRRPDELSGGQAARVALARALATRPRAMLIDEPFAAVDVEYTPRLRVAVKAALAEVGCPSIIVTHDPADVAALADDVAVLDNGRIVEHGPAAEVMASPGSSFGKLLFVRD
ncbi:ATP-binding cassette domain-containing protein [Arachnia propionica]|uniref:ATP-binding cassette domain-containing protein n=1 Tax=Arachnia propionica TaxID=1750 RepID=UPI00242E90D7|nr:ATP-binding cassette domain-containing protein [Arachnia propionica]